MDWLTLSLVSAFSLASADAATKHYLRNYRTRELALVRFTLTGLLLAPLLWWHPLPAVPIRFWYWVGGLVPLEFLAMLLYMRAIRDYPLSLTLPYLAFTPVFVVLTGWLLLGERVSVTGLSGILLVVCGAWLLNLDQARANDWRSWLAPLTAIVREPGSSMMLGVAALYSLTSVMGKGAMQYVGPQAFGPFYFALLGLIALPVLGGLRPSGISALWRNPWGNLLVALCTGLMVIAHFLALAEVQTAYMIAVKRTSLLFGILYGALLFHEPSLRVHLVAGLTMLGGVFLIAS